MNSKLTASTLRIILIIVLILLIGGGTAGFLFIRGQLVTKANEATAIISEAASSQEKLQNLRRALSVLEANSAAEQKAQAMVATAEKYTYQDQIIEDLVMLGKSANVTVKNIDFSSSVPVAATVPAGSNAASPAPATSVSSGVNTTQASVTLAMPARYEDIMRFVRYVEQNTMTMKVSKLGLTGAGKDRNGELLVTCDTLTIGVYTR